MSSSEINTWFLKNKRSFPWRENPTPYRVWVSEIMLQQTRASVVVPYFERWMELFPSIQALAEVPIESVIKAWEGLGYYSRARNLHRGAQYVMEQHGGELPADREALMKIPGLGPYTVGAVLSFGFHQRAAAVDGNVFRVMSRYAWIPEKRKVPVAVEQFLCPQEPWVTAEALIELGATVCTPTPRCEACPLQSSCKAYARNDTSSLPVKKETQRVEKIARGVAVIEAEGHILIRKNPSDQIMGDLSELPYFEGKKTPLALQKELKLLGLSLQFIKPMTIVTHSFTRYLATLFPYIFRAKERVDVSGYQWVLRSKLKEMPFSSGHRKIIGELL